MKTRTTNELLLHCRNNWNASMVVVLNTKVYFATMSLFLLLNDERTSNYFAGRSVSKEKPEKKVMTSVRGAVNWPAVVG